jgi:Mce-associated membrane protein
MSTPDESSDPETSVPEAGAAQAHAVEGTSEAAGTGFPRADPEPVAAEPSPTVVEPAEPAEAVPEPAEPAKAVAEPDEAAASDGPRAPRRRPATPVLVLSALLALALVAATTFGVLLERRSAADRAGAEALATAQAYAVTVTSYEYQNLDRNFADVLDGATGEFKDQYSGASRTLRQLISGAKTTSKGSVLAAGIQSESTDEVVVLLFVDQVITNAVTPQPKIDRTRVTMTLTPHDGRWLVGKLDLQ